jgi:hypothetical protein
VTATSDFSLKPLKVVVYQASASDLAALPPVRKLSSQRTPADFKVKTIKADRPLRRDSTYRPEFTNVPLQRVPCAASLPDEEFSLLQRMKATGRYGTTDAEVLRFIVFSWWTETFISQRSHSTR